MADILGFIPTADCPENMMPSACGGSKRYFMSDKCAVNIHHNMYGDGVLHIPNVDCSQEKRIVLYSDGTLIFNEQYEHRQANAEAHGTIVAQWDAYDPATNPYYADVGTTYDPVTQTEFVEQISDLPWLEYADFIRTIDFDEPISPLKIDGWFAYMSNLEDAYFENLHLENTESMTATCYQNTSFSIFMEFFGSVPTNVKYTEHMFDGCTALQFVRLCNVNLSDISNCEYMFKNCTALQTIQTPYDGFPQTADGTGMFYNCTNLVGGNGTTFDSSKVGITMAVYDNEEHEGYLSECRFE